MNQNRTRGFLLDNLPPLVFCFEEAQKHPTKVSTWDLSPIFHIMSRIRKMGKKLSTIYANSVTKDTTEANSPFCTQKQLYFTKINENWSIHAWQGTMPVR